MRGRWISPILPSRGRRRSAWSGHRRIHADILEGWARAKPGSRHLTRVAQQCRGGFEPAHQLCRLAEHFRLRAAECSLQNVQQPAVELIEVQVRLLLRVAEARRV